MVQDLSWSVDSYLAGKTPFYVVNKVLIITIRILSLPLWQSLGVLQLDILNAGALNLSVLDSRSFGVLRRLEW
jgi:hypothetical protein